jgi:hypothetical protein
MPLAAYTNASPSAAWRSALSPLRRSAWRLDGVVEPPESQIDRRDHLPATPIVGISIEMGLHLRDQRVERLVGATGSETRCERLVRQRGRAEREIECRGAERQDHKRRRRHPPAPPCGRGGVAWRLGLRVGSNKEPARHLDGRARGLVVFDQARRAVAFDLLELVAIDGDVASRTQLPSPSRQRPKHGQNGRERHQCEHEPQRHTLKSIGSNFDIPAATRGDKKIARQQHTPSAVYIMAPGLRQRRTTGRAATWRSGAHKFAVTERAASCGGDRG